MKVMKKKNNYQTINDQVLIDVQLDHDEKKLEQALFRGEYRSAKDIDKTIVFFKQAAKNYRILQKSKPVTFRINQEDLLKFKAKAAKSKIPYQTLLSALIHQFAEGETQIKL